MDQNKYQSQNPLDQKNYPEKPADTSAKSINEIYTEDDKVYLNTHLQQRLESAKRQRESPFAELNGKTYIQIYEENERIANTMLPEKKNLDDVIVSAGTIESKLDALLAHIANLDLTGEVWAFDKENNKIQELGVAIQDTMFMTKENDGGDEGGDEEKKLLRQRELLKQGTVFVQEEWLRVFETKKVLKAKYGGEFKNFAGYDEKLELVFEGPSRTLLHGPNVYLGKITEFFMDKQPYIFAVIKSDYSVAKGKYGKFENWQYVKKGAVPLDTPNEQKTIFDNKWRLTEVKENEVEIIIYQDKPRDEFQIIINGVMMLPIGFPLSAVCPGGNYNIAKQVFRVYNANFAYGKSFVSAGSVKEVAALIDEMLRLFVLKTRKSFSPPYVNTSGKVISQRVLSPGRISMGFTADALQKIGEEGQGVTTSEFNVLEKLEEIVDKSTLSNQFAGQQGKAGTTATEVVELQRQAKLTLGLTIIACALLEKKLEYLRLWNVLENYFNPIDTKVITINDARKEVNQYRNAHRETNIEGEGLGERQVIPMDGELPDAETIRALEREDEKKKGFPVRRIYLSPEGLKTAKLRWYIVVNPKEKETSAFYKLLFREQLADMLSLVSLGSIPNKDGLEEEFSRVWGKNRNKLFQKGGTITPDMAGVSAGQKTGRPGMSGVPNLPGTAVVE